MIKYERVTYNSIDKLGNLMYLGVWVEGLGSDRGTGAMDDDWTD